MTINNRLSFFIMFPILAQITLFYLCFNFTVEMFYYTMFYAGVMFLLSFFAELIFRKKLNYRYLFDRIYKNINVHDRFILLCLGLLIIFLFPLDVFFNGFKLLNPGTYAEFFGPGRYIRHITSLCWMLVPIAYAVRERNKNLARVFIISSVVMPIMMIDRNRLLMSFFCFFFILYIRFRAVSVRSQPRQFKAVKRGMYTLLIMLPTVFVVIGFYRSGSSFEIASSGDAIVYGKYPLTNFFEVMPPAFKQILLYITAPILNFTHVATTEFLNDQFLLSQLSPFSRDAFPDYPYAPVLIVRYNVGTEFYPFLLFGGLPYVFLAMFIVVIVFAIVFYWFCKSAGFYSWLLFLKLAYIMLFLGFAPQFFILYNLMSTLVIFILYIFSYFFRLSTTSGQLPAVYKESK